MESDRSELRWGVEQRLEFIEFRLFWEGQVNRSDLMDQFGVSVNQASTDLNRYIGFAPDNMLYDKSARTYVRGSEFKPQFLEPDASRYLAQLRSVADGLLDREGKLSGVSCPDCGGPMWEMGRGGQFRVRCHTGHVHGEQSLIAAQRSEVERALGVALRVLEERARMGDVPPSGRTHPVWRRWPRSGRRGRRRIRRPQHDQPSSHAASD